MTLIAIIGCVFSPYYARARRHGRADPQAHVAVNVALFGAHGHRWAMTERDSAALDRNAGLLTIGPSSLRWQDDTLIVDIDEIAVPLPRRMRGTIRVTPQHPGAASYPLDEAGRHVAGIDPVLADAVRAQTQDELAKHLATMASFVSGLEEKRASLAGTAAQVRKNDVTRPLLDERFKALDELNANGLVQMTTFLSAKQARIAADAVAARLPSSAGAGR